MAPLSKSFSLSTYNVFLSFGEDTRKNFADHLYTTLEEQRITTYRDDETHFEPGLTRSPPLKAIEGSKIAVIVLSKSYAASSRCLDELAYIMECRYVSGQFVLPIFYDVEPCDVRKQQGDFGRVLEQHRLHKYKKVESWRIALADVGNHSGFDVNQFGDESKIIKRIVDTISDRLRSVLFSRNEDLIGVETGIQHLKSSYVQSVSFSHLRDYDVFLSFRGEDTRRGFVSHLYSALEQQSIYAHRDELDTGLEWNYQFIESIRKSRVAVIVFSKNYAWSSWCLDELVYIMKCREEGEQTVLPIFYDVEPYEVRNQIGAYGEALAHFEVLNNNKVESWRKALSDASNIVGWDVKKTANGYESKCIKEIVDTISQMLHPVLSSSNEDLVGIENRIQDLKSLLEIGSGGVRVVGIWGVGGGGKTTLASSIYSDISRNFDGCFFIENIWQKSSKVRLQSLQEKMLSDILKQKVEVKHVSEGKYWIKSRLHSKKVLIVLDGVDHIDQLEALVGSHNWFGVGSRIIITTKDEHLLSIDEVDVIHNISLLDDDEAVELLHKHASCDYNIRKKDYDLLSKDVVSYAGGLPLAIKILGSILSDKNMIQWESALARLKKLKSSHDGLAPLDLANELQYPYLENSLTLRLNWTLQKHFWNGYKYLLHLSCINLSYVHDIVTTHDFGGLPCLQVLKLHCCSNLEEIHSSLGHHACLVHLSVFRCHKLRMLPTIMGMKKLEILNLSGMHGIVTTPDFGGLPCLKELELHYCSSLEEIHPSLGHHASLVYLSIIWCHKLKMLPTITGMKKLETLEILYCDALHEFPEIHAILDRHMSILTQETIDTYSHGLSSLSSSFPIPAIYSQWRNHDIFLSFIGEYDDSMTFVNHLYSTLIKQGIHTYKPDETLSHSDLLGSSLLNAIEESQIAIIIFTKNYARSSRCLDELLYIMKCIDMRGLHMMPIFYDVSSTNVHEQSGEFGKEFDKLELQNMAKVESWRKALKSACSHSGWSLKHITNRHEGKYIKDIVATISHRLFSLISKVKKDLIGIGSRSESLTLKLAIESGDVYMVGVWGVGGSGKTTIASCVYMEMSRQFEGRCFIENIREKSSKCGFKKLQQKILSTILKKEVVVPSDEKGRLMLQSMLRDRKVLIVLDDVNDLHQVETLAGSHEWFGKGSRIIITSRDEYLLSRKVDALYSVSLLSDDEAIKLFCRYAYAEYNSVDKGKRRPSSSFVEVYDTLSLDVISYANGIPLTLKILGSFLYGKDKDEWIIALAKLRDIPNPSIIDKLKVCYDGLQPDDKELFLDIACFFRGAFVDSIMTLLEAFSFHPRKRLNVLAKTSLITILNGMFDMHDLVQEMAHHIVREEHPQKLTRVWEQSDVAHICAIDTTKYLPSLKILDLHGSENLIMTPDFNGLPNLERLVLSDCGSLEEIDPSIGYLEKLVYLNLDGCEKIEKIYAPYHDAPPNILKVVANMKSLRLLSVRQHVKEEVEEPLFLSDALRWISWENYPASSFPASFHPTMLSGLILRNGLQKVLWQDFQYLPRLKVLDLHGSKNLIMTPDFNGLQNLERLVLSDCGSLKEIDPSIGYLERLVYLNLDSCEKLEKFPPIVNMPKLETLILSGCLQLLEFPEIKSTMNGLQHLYLDHTGIEAVPSTVGQYCINLVSINLIGCDNLKSIEGNFGRLKRRCVILVDAHAMKN